jgi:uncharacterized protein (TIGR02996 family)
MTEEEAFLEAICEEPDNDVPRLVYADWLEEQGRGERAEFIRVQIELGPHHDADDIQSAVRHGNPRRFYALQRHEKELLKCSSNWKGELAVLCLGQEEATKLTNLTMVEQLAQCPLLLAIAAAPYRRGFLDTLDISCQDFLAYAPLLFGQHPITRVLLHDRVPWCNATFADWDYQCGWEESLTWHVRPEMYRLPPALWSRLQAPLVRGDVKCYTNQQAARDALSQAGVQHGLEHSRKWKEVGGRPCACCGQAAAHEGDEYHRCEQCQEMVPARSGGWLQLGSYDG